MQFDSFLIMLLLLFIFPVIILFSNPNIFFAITSIIILLSSFKNINMILFDKTPNDNVESIDEEAIEELETISDIDLTKLIKGIRSLWNLFVIVFFIYCIFYINNVILKEISIIVITYRFIKLIDILSIKNIARSIPYFDKIRSLSSIIVSSLSIIIITIVCCNKFIRFYF